MYQGIHVSFWSLSRTLGSSFQLDQHHQVRQVEQVLSCLKALALELNHWSVGLEMGKWANGPSHVFGPRFSLDLAPMLQSVTQDHFYINATQELVRFANPLSKSGGDPVYSGACNTYIRHNTVQYHFIAMMTLCQCIGTASSPFKERSFCLVALLYRP